MFARFVSIHLKSNMLSDYTRTFENDTLPLLRQQKGFKDVAVDGKWSEGASAAIKKFQESQKLEQTGSINLRTLKALGFNNPLGDIDQAGPAPPKPTK